MSRFIKFLGVITLLTSALVVTATPASAAVNDWEFYAPWGVTSLATDRQTLNNIYVYDIENINGVVYVGGAFEQVVHRSSPNQPINQAFLAAFDAASGDIISTFRPTIDHPVYAIIEHPTTGAVLVGGEFTQVNGQPQEGLVALNPVTGATDSTYDVDIKLGGSWRATVRGLETDGSAIYIGGGFDRVVGSNGSFSRGELAKTNLTGAIDANWDPTVSGGGVWTIALSTDQDRLIAGGRFNSVDGVSRPGIAMVQATGTGALTNTFQTWNQVSPYCYAGYPGCIFVYDLDVADGKILISAAEHFSALHDDTTGNRIKLWRESNDTQAGLIHNGLAWTVRHGQDGGTGLYYAYDLNTFERTVTTTNRLSTGAGGFAYESAGDCVWFGGAVGGMDLANVAGVNKVQTFNLGFMCPRGTSVPASVLDITNWDSQDGLEVRDFRIVDTGYTYGVFKYTPAGNAVRHEIFVDGRRVGTDNDGDFALSDLAPGTSYDVTVRSISAAGSTRSSTRRITAKQSIGERLDTKPGVSTSQISDYRATANSSIANDGDPATPSITTRGFEQWWTIDLGAQTDISKLDIYGRVRYPAQTANLHFMVSDTPFTSDSLATNQQQASVDVYVAGRMSQPTTVNLNGRGRYIRIQQNNTNYLSIGEVDVWGVANVAGEAVPHPAPFSITGNPPPPPAGDLTCDLTVNGTTVTVEWEGNTNADAVIVFRTPTGANTSWRGRVNQPGTTFNDTLRAGVTYNYEIRERTGNTNGDAINCGNATAGNQPPPPAGDLTCDLTVNGTTVTVEWEGNTNADAVIVFRTPTGANTSWRGRVNQPGTTFNDTLRAGVTYNYEIRERTGNTNGDAINCGNATAGNQPPPPAGDLTCDLTVNGTTVTVEWAGNTNADAVIVFRTPAGANTSWRGRVNQPGTTFNDTLRAGVSFNYEIRERTGNTNGDAINCGNV